MKKNVIFLLILLSQSLMAQSEKEIVPVVSIYDYTNMDEKTTIAALEKKYPQAVIKKVEGMHHLFVSQKYEIIRKLVVDYEVKPEGFLQSLNSSQFVCGVGLKTKKDDSPTCKDIIKYETNPVSLQKMELAKIFMQKGELPDDKAFEMCVAKNELELFKLFVEKNGKMPEKSVCESFMESAAYRGYFDFVKYFIDNGISANAKDGDFYALYRAVQYPDIFFYLIEKGADINVIGYGGSHVITHAAREGCIEVIKFILEKGVDPEKPYGKLSAIEMAQKHNEKNSREVVSLLKKYRKK